MDESLITASITCAMAFSLLTEFFSVLSKTSRKEIRYLLERLSSYRSFVCF